MAKQTGNIRTMGKDARRAWTQASFGSKLFDLLVAVRGLISNAMESGVPFDQIVEDETINLNSIITNDEIMSTNLCRQRTRISAAEALLLEQALGNRF